MRPRTVHLVRYPISHSGQSDGPGKRETKGIAVSGLELKRGSVQRPYNSGEGPLKTVMVSGFKISVSGLAEKSQ